MSRARLALSLFAGFLFVTAASSARAQIDCAQCQAVCATKASDPPGYPDDYRPDSLSSSVKHASPEARAAFNDAQKRDPMFGGADIAGAVAGYKKAVLLDDKNAQYRNYLAAALLTAGQPKEAVYNLQAAVRLVPAEGKYLVNLGYAHHRAGDETRALVNYMRGLMLDPRDVRARLFTAFAFEQLGLVDESVLELRRVLNQEPDHELARRALQRLAPKSR